MVVAVLATALACVAPRPAIAQGAPPPAMRVAADTSARIRLLRPGLDLGWTTGAPDARGDGAAFSGVGPSMRVTAGARLRLGPVHVSLRPEVVIDGNLDHQTFPSGDPSRHPLASPFYHGAHSADLPSRPGTSTYAAIAPGESGAWWSGARAFVGVLTSMPEWGPGGARALRPGAASSHPRTPGEGLVLGESAPGLPRLELAYALRSRPATDRLAMRWFAGIARESEWFDADSRNDSRIVSGARLEYERGDAFTAGLARTVMSAGGRDVLPAAFQPFTRAIGDSVIDLLSADVLFALPDAGTLAWIEAARQVPFTSLRDLLRFPTEGIAYRIGLRQRLHRTSRAEWIATVEALRLDQSGTTTDATPSDFYTSPTVIQGWTHRGQPLGAGVGPGGQQQTARLERVGRRWHLGAFVERVRRNDGALLRDAAAVSDRHDVTLLGGVEAARDVGSYSVAARLSAGPRLSYLFQGASSGPAGPVDIGVVRAAISFTPRGGSRRIVGP